MRKGTQGRNLRADRMVPETRIKSKGAGGGGSKRTPISGVVTVVVSESATARAARESARVIALLACEQLATLAGEAGSFDLNGPTLRGQIRRHARPSSFDSISDYVLFRVVWDVWAGASEHAVPVIGRRGLANLTPRSRAAVARALDVLSGVYQVADGVPL